ncbi:hypothetical protein QE419_002550 [Brevundimonas vesicularis]|uniref:hypothetical protein n=1 Tax=Brevundimonas vesicularis TaxID=41276 RepID=UPI002780D040|nr:hypothetical protein [Brevundimonas vesicularis]MDQ1193784.1 hypothetical protein [Brevundimonas vesicularis]
MIDDPLILTLLIGSWVFALGVLVLVLRWLLTRRRRRQAAVLALGRDGEGAMQVPVLATFTGLSGMPSLFAIASNSLNPRLILRPGGLDYRVTFARSVNFDDIASVRIQTAPATTNLVFAFVGGVFTLSANVGSLTVARSVLDAFPELAAKQIVNHHQAQ